jgi:hypothetical protein
MDTFFYEIKNGDAIRVDLQDGEKISVKGKKISSFSEENKSLSNQEIIVITEYLLLILDKMRSVFPPVLHKSINPQNIIIKDDASVALIGFNQNTPNEQYDAPETLTYPTPKSDLYSVGKVLLNLLNENNSDDYFNKFIEVITNKNPDNRFRDIKTALTILSKIKDNTVEESDFNTKSTPSIKSDEDIIHEEFDSSLSNLDAAKYNMNRKPGLAQGGGTWSLMMIAIPVIIFIIIYMIFMAPNNDCDKAPSGYYNDKDCNLILKSKDKKDEEVKEKFKKLGLTKKIK